MDAERRQVTVLFTDTVGFTAFSERSGEEAAYILMLSLSKLMDEAIREQGARRPGLFGFIGALPGAPGSAGVQHPENQSERPREVLHWGHDALAE